VVPIALLEKLASECPKEQRSRSSSNGKWSVSAFNIDAWIEKYGLDVIGPANWQDGRKWTFRICPFDASHTNRSAYIVQHPSGAISAGCHHDSCKGKGWRELHQLFEPNGYERTHSESSGERYDRANGSDIPQVSWGPLGPLPPALPPVPKLPHALIPAALLPWVVDVAERMQVPIDMVVIPAIVVLGSLIGRSLGILPKRYDDWVVVPNLWGAVIGRPGVLKSPAISAAVQFLQEFAKKAAAEFTKARDELEVRRAQIEVEIDKLKAAARKKNGVFDAKLMGELQEELRQLKVVERRYYTSDTTVEKLGELLNDNQRGILQLRDELVGFLRTLDRPGREGDREFFLETWKPLGTYSVDRIGRGTIHIKSLTLSILGGIQPGKLTAYVREAFADGRGADGLLQRFQVITWPDVEQYTNIDRPPDRKAIRRAREIFERIDAIGTPGAGHIVVEVDGSSSYKLEEIGPLVKDVECPIPAIRFDPQAQELFDEWREKLEKRARGMGSDENGNPLHPAYESHIAKYRSLMPSLALIFHVVDVVSGDKPPGAVSLAAAQRAAAWVDEYLDLHARRVYATELRPGPTAARLLAAKIKDGGIADGMSIWEISERGWSGLTHRSTVYGGLEELERVNWVRIHRQQPGPRGGRPSESLRINPAVRYRGEGGFQGFQGSSGDRFSEKQSGGEM